MSAESSDLAIGGDSNGDDIDFTAKRLAQEAQHALTFGQRFTHDVTEEFAAAAKQLQPGQLVKDEYFTLFEAVGALEIMDPKMDSGVVPPGDTLEPEFDVCRGLLPTEIIWIMDELLCLNMIWHDGYPLSQTVFTSLHVDRLLSPDNKAPYNFRHGARVDDPLSTEDGFTHIVLRAYCIALLKSCALVLHTVQSQTSFEEEDFVTHLFGRELLPRFGADDAIRCTDDALGWLADADISNGIREALVSRLQFVRTYLALLINDLDDWGDLLNTLEKVSKTHTLAQPVTDAFSDKVQRQLATSTPPRPMLQISWEEAYTKWTKMCGDILEAERLTSFQVCQSPQCLQRATWAFAYREPPPNTFARAYIQSMLFDNERITEDATFFDLFLADIRDLVLAGDPVVDPDSFQIEMPSDPRHRSSRVMEAFMDRTFDEYMNMYRMVCQNRCRIRRTFTQSIWVLDGLEADAMRTDAELNDIAQRAAMPSKQGDKAYLNPLSSWVKYQKLQTMAWTIQLGFETDIYLPDELCLMYWLLNVFMNRRCDLLEHIERFLLYRMKALNESRNTQYIAESLASHDWIKSLRLHANATRLMALALWKLTGQLLAVYVIEPPKRDYAREALLWDARMKPYLCVTNDPIPTLEDYKQAQPKHQSVESTCNSVAEHIKEAKACIAEVKKMTPEQAKYEGTEEQWKREIKQLETTCVAIAVQTSQLSRVWKSRGEGAKSMKDVLEMSMPEPKKRYHLWWAVPQLKEKKS